MIDGQRVNYVIASWSGARRQGNNFGRTHLVDHFSRLDKLRSSVDQITVVVPENPREPVDYRRFVTDLGKRRNVRVIRRENLGLSYGSFNRAFEADRREFGWWIFMEDDYVPCVDDFDRKLVECHRQVFPGQDDGFLCQFVRAYRNFRGEVIPVQKHAGVTNGIATSSALDAVHQKFGCLPHNTIRNQRHPYYAQGGQIEFSAAFVDAGLDVRDVRGYYRTLYFSNKCIIKLFDGPDIIVPLELRKFPESEWVVSDDQGTDMAFESGLQRRCVEWAKTQPDTWIKVYHGSAFGLRGHPDLYGNVGPLAIYLELKRPGKDMAKAQAAVGRKIAAAGGFFRKIDTLDDFKQAVESLRQKAIDIGLTPG